MPQIPRVEIPKQPGNTYANPRYSSPNETDEIIARGEHLLKTKKDINDTIELNELLAEHTIKARELQSQLLRTDTSDDLLGPTYERQIGELNDVLLKKAKSQTVRDLLSSHLPTKTASKVNEIQGEADKRFTANVLAGYERTLQMNTVAYAGAKTDQDRKEISGRHLLSIEILKEKGVLDEAHYQQEHQRFLRSIQLFDVERALQADPSAGIEAILSPGKFLEKYPNVKLEDLDNFYAKSVQLEERQRVNLERRRKEAREKAVGIIDEATIKGHMDFDKLNQLRDKDLISPEDYRRNAQAIHKQDEEGGVDNPAVRGQFETSIRLSPHSVTTANMIDAFNRGALSRKGLNDLFDLKEKWLKHNEEQAEKVDPRLKGPLYSEGKAKIDQVIGKGLTISGIQVDDNTRRRWGAAMDEYLEEVQRDRTKSHQVIADEIIKKYQGPTKAAEVTPFQFQDPSKPKRVDAKKLLDAWKRESDPRKKRELGELIDKIREAKE
jgi:hypothetical protein